MRWRVRSLTNCRAGSRIWWSPGTLWACGLPAPSSTASCEILSPNSLVLLKLLASAPGAVVSRDVMLEALGGDDPHVVEAAVARLRSAIGAKELIATAVKRGYRLAVDFMPDDTGVPQ